MSRLVALSIALLAACQTTPSHLNDTPRQAGGDAHAAGHGGTIAWAGWTPEAFARAAAEQRLIVVTVVTEWCHWCHVMDEKTWGDDAIVRLMAERFVVIRVDADNRPDLAERYADWGWPALALLTPDGQAVTEWRGYQEARRFESELRAYLRDLDAGKVLARKAPVIDETQAPLAAARDFTRAQLDRFYDAEQGGWGRPQKYPLWAPISAGLFAATVGQDAARLAQVTRTLDGELNLIDRVDGGMFQYSLKGVWDAPHYEKLAEVNGPALENLADAWGLTGDARYKDGARDIARYARTSLRRADGAFYANQDADVGTRGEVSRVLGIDYYALATREARAQVGEPFVDKHVYASHNGRLIAGLARLGLLTGDAELVVAAAQAADVVMKSHMVGDGFSHDEGGADDDVLHLADQTAMGHALLTLAEATGEQRFRAAAKKTAAFIVSAFEDKARGGYFAHTERPGGSAAGVFAERRKPLKHNGEAARFVLKVGRLEDDKGLTTSAERALAAFAVFDVIKSEYRAVGELLLAFEEQTHEPVRFSIVTADPAKPDADALALLAASNAVYAAHRLVDVQAEEKYPLQGKSTLYVCGSTFCSPPITDPAQVKAKSARFLPKAPPASADATAPR